MPIHGLVLQMKVFILSGGFLIIIGLHMVTVFLEYLIDCSIRVSQSCVYNFFWGGGGGGGGGGEEEHAPPSESTTVSANSSIVQV